MAYNARQIAPTDFKPSTGVGIGLPLSVEGVFPTTYTNKDATKSNIINYFLTEPGSRFGNPEFGGGIGAFIFEQINTENLDYLKEDVASRIATQFPNILISSLDVTSNPDYNQVNVILEYSIQGTNDTDIVELTLS